MRYLRLVALFFLVSFLGACCAVHTPQKVNLVSQLEEETVILYQDNELHCAGVFIGPNQILTARHCIKSIGENPFERVVDQWLGQDDWDSDGQVVDYRTRDGVYGKARIKAQSMEDDLAILVSEQASGWYTTLTDVPLQDGQEVHVMGHTAGLPWVYAHGYVASAHRMIESPPSDKTLDRLQISAPIWHGNSGGGAFDQYGRLVGICSFMVTDGNDLGFFIPQDTIRTFLGEHT